VVPWCDRCGTAISQHEILTGDYQKLTHKAIYLKYPIIGRKNEHFLIWTTTPWTLPANVAVAVHPSFEYVKIRTDRGEVLILAQASLKAISQPYKILEKFSGKKLIGLTYKGAFDELTVWQRLKKDHPVVSWKEVSETEGTGLVHVSTGSGPEDYDLGKETGLPVFKVLDESGRYVDGFGFLTGQRVREVADQVFENLKKKGLIYKIHDFTHRYPLCWRCGEELVFNLVDEWYIGMDKTPKLQNSKNQKTLRERMIEVAKKIRWIPEWGLERELDWLRNMEDWLISKKRYWGLALPIWQCQCGHFEVIGSKEELKKRAVKGWKKFAGHTPHRPWIDEVKIRCSKCGHLASRVLDVGNPWLDAGIVSFSTLVDPKTKKVSYVTDKKYWREWFPADFITENFHGQFKNWFYSLIAMSTVLENKEPYRVVLAHALVRDEKGEEMHKSKGNAIEFDEAAEKMGVDVMRWMYLSQNPRLNLNFGFRIGDETRRKFHLLLWNVYKFFVDYTNVDQWPIKRKLPRKLSQLDQWILTRFKQSLYKVTKNLDDFNFFSATGWIEELVQDLSTWYLRRSRERMGPSARDKKDKDEAYAVLYYVLLSLAKVLAPFVPLLAEEIYQNLLGSGRKYKVANSVHLADWPMAKKPKASDKRLLAEMALVRKICELGHSARKIAGIKVRQPLNELRIANSEWRIGKESIELIKDELNLKNVVCKKGKGELKIQLDTKITPKLKAEGEARGLVRQIQALRKKKSYRLDEYVIVYAPAWPRQFEEYIKKKTLAKKLLKGKKLAIR
jgi:isoleucyl-tRNA synthetase